MKPLYFVHVVHLYVSFASRSKRLLFPYVGLTGWLAQRTHIAFSVRYELVMHTHTEDWLQSSLGYRNEISSEYWAIKYECMNESTTSGLHVSTPYSHHQAL